MRGNHDEDPQEQFTDRVAADIRAELLEPADNEPYRREIKAQANIIEGRHDLAGESFMAARVK